MPARYNNVFQLPNVSYEEKLACCLSIMTKQQQELVPLRRDVKIYRLEHDKLKQQIKDWQDKYQQSKEELRSVKKENGKLKKEKRELEQEIEKLTKTKDRYQVALFDHGNFKSPSKDNKKEKGGQIGHADTNRETYEDYAQYPTQRVFAKHCGKCGLPISRVSSSKKKILLDIVINPKVLKVVLESERQWCGNCKEEVTARDPRTLPFTEYGINTFMLVLILRFKSHASFANIATVLGLSHGLKLSKSDVSNLLKQAKVYLKGNYEKLIMEIRKGKVMYNDETGWLVNGKSAWMWIMANDNTTIYVAAESRGKGIFEKMYENSNALSMHDGYAGYASVTGEEKTLYCWAHILRFAYEETIQEKKNSPAILLRENLVRIYHIKENHPEYSKAQLKNILDTELDKILQIKSENESIIAILHRLKTQRIGLINALLYTKDGTNNLAERELRPMVINKKISNGSNTYQGMETSAILGSIIQTLSKRKEDLLTELELSLQIGIHQKYPQYQHLSYADT